MKTCYICKQKLEDSAFYKDDHSEDGLTTSCKSCQRIKAKNYYASHKASLTEQQKAARRAAYLKWEQNNPDRYRELLKKHNGTH